MDLSAAIAAAEKAHAESSQTSPSPTARPDPEGRGLPRREAEELAAIAVKEMGKPMEQALGEVDFCVDIYGYAERPRSSWRTSRSTCWRARAPR